MIFATAIDREAAAVMGTHTHEPTYYLHILPVEPRSWPISE